MERLVRQFTRDFSLYACEWLAEGLGRNFRREIGSCYEDYLIAGNAKTVTSYYIQRNLKEISDALIEKLREDRKWYEKMSRKFREDAKMSRKIISRRRNEKLSRSVVKIAQERHLLLFPMLRLSILVPSVLSERIEKELGKYGKKVISIAYADRKFSDGVFEANDYSIRELAAKRLKELGKPPEFAKILTTSEVLALAGGEKIDFNNLAKRSRGFAYLRNKLINTSNFMDVIKKNNYFIEEEITGRQIRGSTAFDGGIVKGRVCKLAALEDIYKFIPGSVLVSPMTVPDFLPAMKKAAAIVTDEGGITCHAAIVARELKVPCVIGTGNATKILKDGDLVEVNSHTGKVRKLGLAKAKK
ncbi:MAG: PEP-utilizing enzyme [Candidatus Micrarchaeota archaeon]